MALTRRGFLTAGAALAGGSLLPTRAWPASQEEVKMLRFGFIGVGGRGTGLLQLTLALDGISVAAVCDIDPNRLAAALDLAEAAQKSRPGGFGDGPYAYRQLLARDDVDAVIIATPMQLHAEMAVDALRAGKHVLSEVAAAVTLDQCWELVRAVRETGLIYMLAENVCYYRQNLAVLEMVARGVFGELTYAECGYVHDCRFLAFQPDGKLTWRGELAKRCVGNWYPTHSLGPVAQWMGINDSDRLERLVSYSTNAVGLARYARESLGLPAEAVGEGFAGDSNTCLIRTRNGRVIDLRFDVSSERPTLSTTYFSLQGAKASYEDRDGTPRVYVDGRSPAHTWESMDPYLGEFAHALWTRWHAVADTSGHGGADFYSIREFADCVRDGRPAPIGVVDAVTWSSIIPLSAQSVLAGGEPREIPDFAGGG
jgi:predicted dehydrogenase